MIKPVKHTKLARASMATLWERVRYIANPHHKNHVGKQVLPSKNYNCRGPRPWDLFRKITRNVSHYKQRREGKRGKRTQKKWEEYDYSSPEGTIPLPDGKGMEPCLSDVERDKVEQGFLSGPFRNSPVRLAWHIDTKTGRCDCHFLVGVHDEQGILWQYHGFGKGKKNLKLELERLEEKFIKELNKDRPTVRWIRNARQMHKLNRRKAGQLTCAQKLALMKWDCQPDTLDQALKQAGYLLIRKTKKQIVVQNTQAAKYKEIPYNFTTLAQNCRKAMAKFQKSPPPPDEPDVTEPGT